MGAGRPEVEGPHRGGSTRRSHATLHPAYRARRNRRRTRGCPRELRPTQPRLGERRSHNPTLKRAREAHVLGVGERPPEGRRRVQQEPRPHPRGSVVDPRRRERRLREDPLRCSRRRRSRHRAGGTSLRPRVRPRGRTRGPLALRHCQGQIRRGCLRAGPSGRVGLGCSARHGPRRKLL